MHTEIKCSRSLVARVQLLLHSKIQCDESHAAVRFLGVVLEESDARSAGKVAHVRPTATRLKRATFRLPSEI
jgi:hypothetical protein